MLEKDVIIILFILLLLFPFTFGLSEFFLKKNARSIPIDAKRTREPDYFGKSFIKILTKALKELNIEKFEDIPQAYLKLNLRWGKEWVGFLRDERLLGEIEDKIVIFMENTNIERKHNFSKEVGIFGNAVFDEKCIMRSLYVQGNCLINAPFFLARWLHVDNTLEVKAKTNLGISVYSKKIKIRDKTEFTRMFAEQIDTCEEPLIDEKAPPATDAITIKGSLTVNGEIKIDGDKRSVVIDGDIFSENNIEMLGNVWVKGNLFTQKHILLKNGVVVGEKGKIKSAVARGKIIVHGPFRIYGYMHSENGGIITP